MGVGAASVALGVVAALAVQSLGDDSGDGGDKALAKGEAKPSVSASPPGSRASSGEPGKEPAFIEATNPERDFWTPTQGSPDGGGSCSLPAEERAGQGQLQASLVNVQNPAGKQMNGKVKISFRFKYADPSLGRPYYVSVAVKPPHEIDVKTGKPFEGLTQANLSLGYTSKPVDLLKSGTPSFGAPYVELTYPDDFQQFLQGKPYAPGIPVGNDPGNWTVLFQHVKGPKEYANIACYGFVAR